jgi:hypothetical protein
VWGFQFRARAVRPGKTPSDNALDDEMVGRAGRAHTDTEVELPPRPEIDVNDGEKLLLLVFQGIESGKASNPASEP